MKILKCEDRFCSDPSIKDIEICQTRVKENNKTLGIKPKFRCFWQKDGKGCEECGEKVAHQSGCTHCLSCGASKCS